MKGKQMTSYRHTWEEAYLDILPTGYAASVDLEISFEGHAAEPMTRYDPGCPAWIEIIDAHVTGLTVYDDDTGEEVPGFILTDEQRCAIVAQFWREHSFASIEEAISEREAML